jgi:hypothetical protein
MIASLGVKVHPPALGYANGNLSSTVNLLAVVALVWLVSMGLILTHSWPLVWAATRFGISNEAFSF